jgi:hypothetical protein
MSVVKPVVTAPRPDSLFQGRLPSSAENTAAVASTRDFRGSFSWNSALTTALRQDLCHAERGPRRATTVWR